MPKKIEVPPAFSGAANSATNLFGVKCACGLGIGDGKGHMKRGKTDIDDVLEQTANLVFFAAPFNKIVGDRGPLALHREKWRSANAQSSSFYMGLIWQRLESH